MTDILGIGNAIVDIFSFSDDEIALSLGLHPNYALHVSSGRMDELVLGIPAPLYVSGGSASNALKGAAALGAECAFVGCSGTWDSADDECARVFRNQLSAAGVRLFLEPRKAPTGRCLVVRMPGGLKSVACAPGAAPTLRAEQVTAKLVSESRIVFLDGQALRDDELAEAVISRCRESGTILAVDAASPDIARDKAPLFRKILAETDAILFMNADEARALAIALEKTVPGDRGIQSWDSFTDTVFSFYARRRKQFPCIVEKRAERGSRAWISGALHEAPAIPAAAVLDDTAAGDIFDGAFLCAMLRDIAVPDALAFANRAAFASLDVPGSSLDGERFAELRSELAGLVSGR